MYYQPNGADKSKTGFEIRIYIHRVGLIVQNISNAHSVNLRFENKLFKLLSSRIAALVRTYFNKR